MCEVNFPGCDKNCEACNCSNCINRYSCPPRSSLGAAKGMLEAAMSGKILLTTDPSLSDPAGKKVWDIGNNLLYFLLCQIYIAMGVPTPKLESLGGVRYYVPDDGAGTQGLP